MHSCEWHATREKTCMGHQAYAGPGQEGMFILSSLAFAGWIPLQKAISLLLFRVMETTPCPPCRYCEVPFLEDWMHGDTAFKEAVCLCYPTLCSPILSAQDKLNIQVKARVHLAALNMSGFQVTGWSQIKRLRVKELLNTLGTWFPSSCRDLALVSCEMAKQWQ